MRRIFVAALMTALAIPMSLQAQGASDMTSSTLSGGIWKVIGLTGQVLPSSGSPTIEFLPDGHVAGHSGCNRFRGAWAQEGEKLELSQVVGTMMACEQPKMKVEAALHRALARTRLVTITAEGTLELMGEEGLLLRAER